MNENLHQILEKRKQSKEKRMIVLARQIAEEMNALADALENGESMEAKAAMCISQDLRDMSHLMIT